MATPGASVGSGALITPGGAQGPQGAAGTYAPHAATHVTGGSDIIVPASSSTSGLLKQVSGLTTDFVDGTNNCQNLDSGVAKVISQRTRGYNAIGNPNFEIDQRNVGNSLSNPTAGTFLLDRWIYGKSAGLTAQVSTQRLSSGAMGGANQVIIPGTNFTISYGFLRITLTTAQVTLAAGDYLRVFSNIEGTYFRELQNDVHSVSLLVRSSVAGLKFGLTLRDPSSVQALAKLCTIPNSATWTLIPLPNLPIWPSGSGTFSSGSGVVGYELDISLGAGSTFTVAANDTWQSGNLIGALGQDNFASKAVNSTFDIAFVQHEPGPLCTQLIDKPFSQNLDECLRYYEKSYRYSDAVGSITTAGAAFIVMPASANPNVPIFFKKTKAKTPTIGSASPVTGAFSAVRDVNGALDRVTSSYPSAGDTGFGGCNLTTLNAAVTTYQFHWTADTGW